MDVHANTMSSKGKKGGYGGSDSYGSTSKGSKADGYGGSDSYGRKGKGIQITCCDGSKGLSLATQRDLLHVMVQHRDLRIAELEQEVVRLTTIMMSARLSIGRLYEHLVEEA